MVGWVCPTNPREASGLDPEAVHPTASGLDIVWSGLATGWALALVGAYEWSVRRDAVSPTATARERPNASP
jgi:hypothetical protein